MRLPPIAFILLSVFVLSVAPVKPVLANEEAMALKVDIAGRQRMLTQRIAKAACYISLFSDVDKHLDMLKRSTDLFDKSLNALKHGDKNMYLPAETNQAVLNELDRVSDQWKYLEFASRLLHESSAFPGADVELILEYNMPALKESHAVVTMMDGLYSNKTVSDSSYISAINVAGRQRMLSQKAAKEFCLISYGKNVKTHQANLKQTIHQFDQGLKDLHYGNLDKNILPAPTEQVIKRLDNIQANWRRPREVMLNAANGKISRGSDFKVVSFANEMLLQQSNAVVKMLVQYDKEQAFESQ